VPANDLLPRRQARWSGITASGVSAALKWLFRASVLAPALYQSSEKTAAPDPHALVEEHIGGGKRKSLAKVWRWKRRR